MIAHPFKFAGDIKHRSYHPQILGDYRLLGREHVQGFVLNYKTQPVNFFIVLDYKLREMKIAAIDGINSLVQSFIHQVSHVYYIALQLPQIMLKAGSVSHHLLSLTTWLGINQTGPLHIVPYAHLLVG